MSDKSQKRAFSGAGLGLAILLALFAVAPLLTHAGLPNTADGPAHLMRQVELNQAWQDGVFYPRWAPDLALGHGMPLFNYAPPWLYHLTQLFHLTGLPLDASMKAGVILAMIVYSAGMYLFAADLFGPRGGLLAAAVYLYAPYRLREAYIQGNYGQFWGLAFYPLILWAFRRLITTRQQRYLLPAALALAGLLLSHNISAMLFAPLLGLYLLYLLRPADWSLHALRRLILPAAGAAILGLGLSAFFWLPAFGEKNLIRLAGITSGFFDFRRNFIELSELLALPRPLDVGSINPYFPLSLGLAQITPAVLALATSVALGLRRGKTPALPPSVGSHLIFFGGALLVYAFMTLPQSQAVWEAVPLIALAEFPWRLLGPAVFCAAVVAGVWPRLLEIISPRAADAGLILGLALAVAANLYYLVPDQFIRWGTPAPADAVAYEIESGAIGTTSTGEFLPRWADSYPTAETLSPDYAAGRLPATLNPADLPAGATAQTVRHSAAEIRIAVDTPAPFTATLRVLYWPGWRVSLIETGRPGADVQFTVTRPDGLIRAVLPAGAYTVSLRQTATPLEQIAAAVSILSLVGAVGWLGLGRLFAGKSPAPAPFVPPAEPLSRAMIIALGMLIVAGTVFVQLAARQFRMQSPPDTALPAAVARRADFGEELRLLGLDLPPQVVSAGDKIEVTAYWRALARLKTDYAVYLHLDTPAGQTIAAADQAHPAEIPTSAWPPTLYLRNPLRLDVPPNAPPIRYDLRLGLVQHGSAAPLLTADGQTSLKIGSVWVKTAAPVQIPPGPRARFGEAIKLLGARYDFAGQTVTLYWQTAEPLAQDYSIFVHLLDANGAMLGGIDGAPYQNQYATSAWMPGQVIEDARVVSGFTGIDHLAVGVYLPATGERLPAVDEAGAPLPDNALRIYP